jgi:hypothetical protein
MSRSSTSHWDLHLPMQALFLFGRFEHGNTKKKPRPIHL